MAMGEPPLATLPAEHERHPQRPVLGRVVADLAVLPLDDDEDDEVARGVGLDTSSVASPDLKNRAISVRLSSDSSKPWTVSPPVGDMSV